MKPPRASQPFDHHDLGRQSSLIRVKAFIAYGDYDFFN
jgi:hypothetical protein